jgi:hypothetical protein
MPSDATTQAELAATYIVSRLAARAGSRLKQGAWSVPLATAPLGPSLDLVAHSRLVTVGLPVARALVAWARGEVRVQRLDRVPRPLDVLALQARGERCVSLLADSEVTAPHDDGLAFAMHDLCHLDKFIDPEHHTGQVGFFRAVHAATEHSAWDRFVARFDAAFVHDLEHVVADMNGSAVFLFAALKMKLKMAVRRRVARALGRLPAPGSGPLDDDENAAFAGELATLLSLIQIEGHVRDAAVSVRTRRDDPAAALAILRYFEARGADSPRWRAVS